MPVNCKKEIPPYGSLAEYHVCVNLERKTALKNQPSMPGMQAAPAGAKTATLQVLSFVSKAKMDAGFQPYAANVIVDPELVLDKDGQSAEDVVAMCDAALAKAWSADGAEVVA